MDARRKKELKAILETERRELLRRIEIGRGGLREERRACRLREDEVDLEEDVALSILQMKAGILNRVKDALGRLEYGDYGDCTECGEEIQEARLRALPFAVRCKDCEEQREISDRRERHSVRFRNIFLFG
ncbi:MAG TPA: TraR/DksA C4-type zinc finger protein [Candidatus Paceibacterota bacterium]